MRKQWLVVGLVVIVLAAVAVLFVKLSPAIFPVEVDSRAPDFRATSIETGKVKTIADYKGKVVLLNVWATWCQPCRLEMPSMQRLQEELAPEGLAVVAVSIDGGGADVVQRFARDYGLTFEILHDPSSSIERIYQTTGVPESFVINKYGVIVKKIIGAADWDAPVNRDLIRRLLAQSR
jgi:cytochrome c biogenesis protein CcmG/thiol:disulfide interchange protein DsbE